MRPRGGILERQRPDTTSNEIELYIRTYYSLLRSTGEVRVRSFEEAHCFSRSSLHPGARDIEPDIDAFGYAAARVPDVMDEVEKIVLGQSTEQFEDHGYRMRDWHRIEARGRRRAFRFDGSEALAAFIASASDIDDLIPIVTAYQIEWNKMHALLQASDLGRALAEGKRADSGSDQDAELAEILGLDEDGIKKLRDALGSHASIAFQRIARAPSDRRVILLEGSFNQYQTAAQKWWSGIEPLYLRPTKPRRPAVYFVSSNTHSLANLIGGYARAHRESLLDEVQVDDQPQNIDEENNLLYYALRTHLGRNPDALDAVQRWDAESGFHTAENPVHVEVDAQVIDLSRLRPERLDPRVRVPGMESLRESQAVIINIDYPLGLAAYHLMSRLGQGIGPLRGAYIMGKAATLNGHVGDVSISRVVHDEHSRNTYLFRNAFAARDVAPYLKLGSVMDNQKAVTVRSAFLQNSTYMGVVYREGFTVLEMEAGPYMSALYELLEPRRHPNDQIIDLGERSHFEFGVLHYASDTPYSRRQELLSKSLGYFGIDATYACATVILRRILEREVAQVTGS